MKTICLTFIGYLLFYMSGCSQNTVRSSTDKIVGGGCDGCDLIYEGMPSSLHWATTISRAGEPGQPLIISGTIYKKDGKTPAPGVILCVYHTDHSGKYSPSTDQTAARRHGHLRGWMKTGTDGRYQFRRIT